MIFFLCQNSKHECQKDMDMVQFLFNRLGIPLAVDKTIGPLQILTYLGIEIDVPSSTIRLPEDKFIEL